MMGGSGDFRPRLARSPTSSVPSALLAAAAAPAFCLR
jgi:hypothetical protein